MSVRKIISIPIYLMCLLFIFSLLYVSTFLSRKLSYLWFEPLYVLACRLTLAVLQITIHVRGIERTLLVNKAIYISNHPSKIEIFLLPLLIPSLDGLIEAESLSIPLLGRIFAKTPSVFINRASSISRYSSLRCLVKKLKTETRNIVIFPEGRPSQPISQKFYNGAFFLSKKSGLPIIPIYLDYSDKDAFKVDKSTSNRQLFLKILKSQNKGVVIYFFEPVFPTDYPDITSYANAMHTQYTDFQTKLTQSQMQTSQR